MERHDETPVADGSDRADHDTHDGRIDWGASVRLGVVASAVAAMLAITFAGRVPETTIIVGVIVLATMASWFQLEQPHGGARRAHVAVRDRHRRVH